MMMTTTANQKSRKRKRRRNRKNKRRRRRKAKGEIVMIVSWLMILRLSMKRKKASRGWKKIETKVIKKTKMTTKLRKKNTIATIKYNVKTTILDMGGINTKMSQSILNIRTGGMNKLTSMIYLIKEFANNFLPKLQTNKSLRWIYLRDKLSNTKITPKF